MLNHVYLFGKNVIAVRIGSKRKLYTIPWTTLKRSSSADVSNEECVCCKKKFDCATGSTHKEYCYFDAENCSRPYTKGLLMEYFIIGWVNEIYAVVVPHSLLINCAVCLNAEEQNRIALFQCGHCVCLDCLVMLVTRDTCVVCKSVLASVQFLGCCAQPIEKTFNCKTTIYKHATINAAEANNEGNVELRAASGVNDTPLQRWRKLIFKDSSSTKLSVNYETFLTSIVSDDPLQFASSLIASNRAATLNLEKRQLHVDVVGVKWFQSMRSDGFLTFDNGTYSTETSDEKKFI